MEVLLFLFGVLLVGTFIGFVITQCFYIGMFTYRYPPDFVLTSYTSGTSATSGGTEVSSGSTTDEEYVEPGTKEFWKIFERAAKKNKPLRSEMNRRKPQDRIDFEKIQSNGFVGYEYLIDGTIADVEAVKLHVGCTN